MKKKTKIKECAHCLESFESRRSDHKYCERTCSTKACYKRNGYIYVNGSYKKPKAANKENSILPALASSSAQLPQQIISSVTEQAPIMEKVAGHSPGITGRGVAEAAIGSSMVALGEYFAYFRPMLQQLNEMQQKLDALNHKLNTITNSRQPNLANNQPNQVLNQKTTGQFGNKQTSVQNKPGPTTQLTPHQLNLKRMGLDPHKYGGSSGGMPPL